MRGHLLVCAIALGIPLAVACGSNYGDENHTGERFNACYANGTCNTGLTCIDGLCVLSGEVGEAGRNDEGGLSDVNPSAVDAGDSGGDADLARIVTAFCALSLKCNPKYYAAAYGKTSCEETFALGAPLEGTTPRTAAQVDACVARISAAACTESSTPFAFAECAANVGTRKSSQPCAANEQCADGLCAIAKSDVICGTCAASKSVGDDCPIDGPLSCGVGGLFCSKSKCVKMLALGSACIINSSSDVCTFNAACIDAKCQRARDSGEPCTETANCRVGFECSTGKCLETAFRAVGQQCGFQQPPCARSNCNAGGDVGTCVPYGTEGMACGGSAGMCATGFSCDTSINKCAKAMTAYDCR